MRQPLRVGPDVAATHHGAVLRRRAVFAVARPSNVEALVQITPVLRVCVFAEERGVAFVVWCLVDVQLERALSKVPSWGAAKPCAAAYLGFLVQRKRKEVFSCVDGTVNRWLRYVVVLN